MRSLLFVPADSPRKLARALGCRADVLILDLEDSVALPAKEAARRGAAEFLGLHRGRSDRPALYVRINGLGTGLADADLDAVMPAGPDGIVLPKSRGGADVTHLDAKLAVCEAMSDLADGTTGIVPVATETAEAVFGLGTYRGASARLAGLTWGAEDLSADLGATTNRGPDGRVTEPFRLARSLCLFGAVAAEVAPIDTVYPDYRDRDGLRREALEAARDGFTGKLAIHPDQVAVINDVFTPSAEAVAAARRIVDAFAAAGDAGVIGLDGAMLDRPHLTRAETLIARAQAVRDRRSVGT